MTINALIFASLADRLGTDRIALELNVGATAGDLLDALGTQFPDVAAFRGSIAVAVNMSYVKADHVLSESDEVALIPPVSGG